MMSKYRLQNVFVLGILIALVLSTQINCRPQGVMSNTAIRLKIERGWKGDQCSFTKAERLVISTEGEWKEVWEKMHSLRLPKPELPNIKFKKKMVIAVFMGERQSGGYDIEIIDIFKKEKEIVVVVDQKEPSPDSLRTMALTSPYHVVIVKRSSLPVRFQSLQENRLRR